MGDYELLQRYSECGSHEAFAELMRRHVNLVYSAARRQVRSPHIAQEVTQAVFFDLSRSAGKLKPAQPLAAWLFVVTRRAAIDALRRETRRRAREHMITEITDMKNSPDSWTEVEPLLDEAVASLTEADRTAILLRFFENKSLREIGEAIGASDDAAQKRVARAIEQLRTFFGKHGVAVSAAMLSTNLSAQAVQAAPPALLGALVSGTAVITATAMHVSQIIVMTTLKKAGFTAAFVLVTSVGLYQAHELSLQRDSVRALEQRLETVLAENRDLLRRRAEDAAKLARVSSELASAQALATAGDPAIESALEAWLDRVQAIKGWLEKMPDKRIPQMDLLTEDDWLDAAKNAKVDTELGAREAIAKLRYSALERFSEPMREAMGRYTKANNKQLPSTAMELAPYFTPAVDSALLQNYEIYVVEGIHLTDSDGREAKQALTSKIVDDIFDARVGYTVGGSSFMQGVNVSHDVVADAVRAFRKANNGQSPANASQVAPYLERAVQPEYLAQLLREVEKIK
jgi:RNA polymerase sigma factor (sigma-70 family)